MGTRDIALMGRARSGKDTVAAYLCETYGYTRVAFADPLREAALKLDPIISRSVIGGDLRLSHVLDAGHGWEYAKNKFPEVRRILQHIGQGVRDLDEDFWLSIAVTTITDARNAGRPVVITDCRYPNEYNALRASGFTMTRVVRPDRGDVPGSEHVSETALNGFPADWTLCNISTLEDLYTQAAHLATR
jgi:hypothetical protein